MCNLVHTSFGWVFIFALLSASIIAIPSLMEVSTCGNAAEDPQPEIDPDVPLNSSLHYFLAILAMNSSSNSLEVSFR